MAFSFKDLLASLIEFKNPDSLDKAEIIDKPSLRIFFDNLI